METGLFDFYVNGANRPFSGWDFSLITATGRTKTEPLPWSYASRILPFLRQADSALDMGTGGGEFLSYLAPFPPFTCATEAYPPNVPVARARLEPLGAQVYAVEEKAPLPFEDETFDLVINRHEEYSPAEVWRIVKPGGCFITQQVGGSNDLKLNEWLESPLEADWDDWHLDNAVKDLQAARWNILEAQEAFVAQRFFDIGALVYHLQAIPWQIADFSVEKYYAPLERIHERIQKEGYIDVPNERFLIIAQKGVELNF